MTRLRLEMEELKVESFEIGPALRGRGTVLAHAAGASDKATCDSCAGPQCKPSRESCASGGDVCCA
jgi:hypothetical protein